MCSLSGYTFKKMLRYNLFLGGRGEILLIDGVMILRPLLDPMELAWKAESSDQLLRI